MKAVVIICFVSTALAIPGPEKRIVNGFRAVLFSHPYQASIQVHDGRFIPPFWYHTCGGVVIAPNKILTAAHCLENRTRSRIRVKVGALNLDEGPNAYEQTINVSSFVMHADFMHDGAKGFPNDIGIIYLASPVVINANVQIANLAPRDSSFANTKCVISGWGKTFGSGSGSPQLLEANITSITTANCAARWSGHNINIKHICVYETVGTFKTRPSSCMGDSGGPMMCGSNFQYLAGITSWGVYDCDVNYPSVYTRVSEYLDWIAAR